MTPFAEVVGDPVAHSKSPLIHRFWLSALGLTGDYLATRVATDALSAHIETRRHDARWRGCNVTIPHKIDVMALVDDPGDVRGSIGAMNTILRAPDGTLTGTNTDAAGFYAPIAGLPLTDAPVAVVGTGGAAHAVLFALARANVGAVTMIARNSLKAGAMLARFGLKGTVQSLGKPVPPVALLVNATQLGMAGQQPLDLVLDNLRDDTVVYDIVYAPLDTGLLRAASERGLAIVDGLDMLIGQAALAFALFFGVEPPRDRDDELRALLTS